MRARIATSRIAVLAVACWVLAACSTLSNLLPWHTKTTSVTSVRVAAPPGANLNSATMLDLVFVYDTTSAAMLPKTGPDWFAQKTSLQNGLGPAIDVVSLQVPPATVIDTVSLPKRAGKALTVYGFANYQSPDGQARIDLTQFRHPVIWLAPTQISVTEQ
ncbi:hypothetical protein DWU98_15915 [Dyella monticola]|uniref:Type VI secretion system lipoprotein TssJ n=1 Tax=Dyella monticola TaxID=1927958 RepID=A0A370WUV3_9GAMM|nr:hypothetical protein [Dyella monticola]RDS79924.1 hypothetical protein DWU98_15915 [Dyella monticola]